jgi:ubiquinone/menaquinone biosynthesis C-methylase UbiE
MKASTEILEHAVGLLSCPDDGHNLRLSAPDLCCDACERRFLIHADNFVELLPRAATVLDPSVEPAYRDQYLDLFGRKVSGIDENGSAWGAPESVSPSWMRKRQRQVRAVGDLLTRSTRSENLTLCDVAAGAGHYTFAYAKQFKLVLHCDLSPENLNYSRRKAGKLGLRNILFLRIDYFRLPFRHCLDRVICMDTIIRGSTHDALLLKALFNALGRHGEAVIDFHNWWHNPFRRLGLLKDNFFFNKSYSRREAESLLASVGAAKYKYAPFYQEFDPHSSMGLLCSRLVPPTRIMYSVPAN